MLVVIDWELLVQNLAEVYHDVGYLGVRDWRREFMGTFLQMLAFGAREMSLVTSLKDIPRNIFII